LKRQKKDVFQKAANWGWKFNIMCRLLLVHSEKPFEIRNHLTIFAEISKKSKVYQGHGWGCAYLKNNQWHYYKNIKPIWEDNLNRFPKTKLLLGHTRSAFRDENIAIENNMPFYDDQNVFIFNGELHGVRIQSEGRIGAEKVFNTIKRFHRDNMLTALKKAVMVINKRSRYIKAMNVILSDKQKSCLATQYSEDPDYFTMSYKRSDGFLIICSEAYPEQNGWVKISNHTVKEFKL
jgi:predicted glutamine amidotransferase